MTWCKHCHLHPRGGRGEPDADRGGRVNGTGNGLGNTISGNSAVNRLDGNGGNDTMTGFGGADVFVFDDGDGADIVTDFQNDADAFDLTAVRGSTTSAIWRSSTTARP